LKIPVVTVLPAETICLGRPTLTERTFIIASEVRCSNSLLSCRIPQELPGVPGSEWAAP
jgi:hypothetical protein